MRSAPCAHPQHSHACHLSVVSAAKGRPGLSFSLAQYSQRGSGRAQASCVPARHSPVNSSGGRACKAGAAASRTCTAPEIIPVAPCNEQRLLGTPLDFHAGDHDRQRGLRCSTLGEAPARIGARSVHATAQERPQAVSNALLRLAHTADILYGRGCCFLPASKLFLCSAPAPASMGGPPLMPKSCVVLVTHGGKADDLTACAWSDAHPRVHSLVENGCCGTLLLTDRDEESADGWHRLVSQFLGDPGGSQDAETIPTRWAGCGDFTPRVGRPR